MTKLCLGHRRLVIALWAALLLGSGAVVGRRALSERSIIDNSVGVWFMKDDPELKIYRAFNDEFGRKEWSLVLLQAESIYDPLFLRDLAEITARLERVDHVSKVVSIANVRDSRTAEDGTLEYRRLYPAQARSQLLTPAEVDRFRAELAQNPILEGSLVRRGDSRSTVLLLQSDNFIDDPAPYRIALVDSVARVLAEYPRVLRSSLAGTAVINAELNRSSRNDVIVFYVLVTLFTVVVGWLVLRSGRDLVVVLATVSGAALPPMALLALLGIPYNMVTVMLPPVLITLSVCDVVHVVNAFHYERKKLEPAAAAVSAIEKIWTPCMWTSVVTVVGFLSLSFSTVFPIWQMGVFSALGVAIAWLMTMTCAPVLLVMLWPHMATEERRAGGVAKEVGLYAKRLLPLHAGRWRWVWLATAGALVCSVYGIARLEVDTNYTEFFSESMYVTRAYRQIREAGYGQSPVSLVLRFPPGTTYAENGHLDALLAFEAAVRKQPAVVKLLTFTDLLDRADTMFNGDRRPRAGLQGYSSAAIQQLHLLAEMAGNDDLRDFVSDDKRTVQLVAMTPYMSSRELEAFKRTIRALGKSALPPGVALEVTGTTVQWANMDREISHTQMSSMYVLALVFVVLLPIIFRSWALGAIGLLINGLPLAITFGVMGMLDIKINVATALIGGVAIGATVDSTIFFINGARLALREGMTWHRAVDHAVLTVGDGIIMTSVILAGGFCCLAASRFLPTANFGSLVSASIVISLFMDIMVNPIVLKLAGAKVSPQTKAAGEGCTWAT